MSKRTIELIRENELLELLSQASIEAIQYTLELEETTYPEDALLFLQMWNEGLWEELKEEFPKFDLNSTAQKALIKESGSGDFHEPN